MNDIRHTILWVIFAFSLVMLWDQWQIYNGRLATFFPSHVPTATHSKPSASASGIDNSVPAPSRVPDQPLANALESADPSPVAHEVVQVETDVFKLDFDTEGGSLVRAQFLKYHDMSDKNQGFTLLDHSQDRIYLAQSGLIAQAGGPALPTHKSVMHLQSGERHLQNGRQTLELRFESPIVGGVQLVKTYTLMRGSYAIAVRHEVINQSSAAIAPQLYLQLVRDGNKPLGESSFYSTFTGPAVYTDLKKYQKVEFSSIEKNNFEIEKSSDTGYVAMVQHYFASAWLLDAGRVRDFFMRKIDTNLYAVGMITPIETLAPGARKTVESRFFAGPQEEKILESLTPGLELVKDYGWLTILAKPLYWLLVKLHAMMSNWGWAIVALVVLLKVAFYWLNAKAYASMAKMKAVNPRIMEMRDRLKDNPQQMQQEIMRIYREEKVNPMGGCLPIMVQIPVFIALYWVLLSSVEMRNAPWLGWIHDLSSPDPLYILPLIMTLTTVLQTSLNPAPPDPLQAKMMWIMPLVFSVMFFFFPSGLVLYWITNNILSILQQWIINTRMGVPPQFNLPKF